MQAWVTTKLGNDLAGLCLITTNTTQTWSQSMTQTGSTIELGINSAYCCLPDYLWNWMSVSFYVVSAVINTHIHSKFKMASFIDTMRM